MITQAQINAHTDAISSVIDLQSETVFEIAKAVETQLAEYILSLSDPSQLVNGRLNLLTYFSPFNELPQSLLADLVSISNSAIELHDIAPRDPQDTLAESALSTVASNEIVATVEESKNSIIDELIIAAIAGVAIKDIAVTARYMVSGLFMDSGNTNVRRLQRQLKNALVAGATPREISNLSNKIRTGLNLQVPRTQNVIDKVTAKIKEVVVKFESAFTINRAKRNGIKKFRYAGGIIKETRDFCAGLNGQVLTEAEIKKIWTNSSWQGKSPGSPFIVRGGYNCRHYWVPIADE